MMIVYLDEVIERRDSEIGHAETRGGRGRAGLVQTGEAGLEGGAGGNAIANAGGNDNARASEHLTEAGGRIERELPWTCSSET
jgi:hypothetical protein